MIASQVWPRASKRIVVVTDEPDKYPSAAQASRKGVAVHHRRDLQAVQKELAKVEGVTRR